MEKWIDERAIGAMLQSKGLVGKRALLLYPPGLDYILGVFGCLYAGVVAVLAYPPRRNRSLRRLHTIVAGAQATAALTTKSVVTDFARHAADDPLLALLQRLQTDELDEQRAREWEDPQLSTDILAFLQYTSRIDRRTQRRNGDARQTCWKTNA